MTKKLGIFFIAALFISPTQSLADSTTQDSKDTSVSSNDSNHTDSETFLSTKPPELTLTEIEGHVRKTVNKWKWSLMPSAIRMTSFISMSRKCIYSLGNFGMQAGYIKDWSFQILDATGKITDGILEGTSMALGDYDECQNAVVGGGKPTWVDDTGQYCLLEIRPPRGIVEAVREYQTSENKSSTALAKTKTFFSFLRNVKGDPEDIMFLLGVCVPPKCSAREIQNAVDYATENIRLPVRVRRCEKKRFPHLEIHHIVILSILGIAVGLVLIGTLLDALLRLRQADNEEEVELNKFLRFLMNFSLFFNTSKLFDAKQDGNALDPIRGLKVISVILIIFVDTYALPDPLQPARYRSAFNFWRFTDDLSFAVIANSSVAVDTIFFIVGFLSVYYYWKQDFQMSIVKYIFKFFFVQYLRFILAQILTMCLFSLLPLIGSGPLWTEFVEKKIESCTEKWWINLLCIQNFWSPMNSCLYHTWILATSMQMYALTVPVLWVFRRYCRIFQRMVNLVVLSMFQIGIFLVIVVIRATQKPQVAMVMNVVIILASIIIVAVLTAVKELPATVSAYFSDEYRLLQETWMYIYVQAYTHMGSYSIGMIVAYMAVKYSSVRLGKPGALLCWCAAFTTCFSIIYGLYDYRGAKPMQRGLAVFYAAVHRTAWASAVGWMIYACATGYGSFINAVLSWKLYVPLERLSYMAYIIHVPLMYYHGGIQRERIFMGQFNQAMNFLSYTVISFIISYFTFVLFQGPYNALECFVCMANSHNVWQSKQEENQKVERKISCADTGTTNYQDTPVVLFNKSTETIVSIT